MDDKTIIIIMFAINIVMWWFTLDFMIRTKHVQAEESKKYMNFLTKCGEYYDESCKHVGRMTEMNVKALQHFSEQITDIMSKEGTKNDAEKNR